MAYRSPLRGRILWACALALLLSGRAHTVAQFHTLTVGLAGTGTGTVTESGGGITCGADCDEAYLQGTAVTLTATAAADSAFVGWTGAASCPAVTMDTAHSCTATFEAFHTLTVGLAGTGTGTVTESGGGITCGADCDEAYLQGTAVTLTATAAADSAFVDWTGAASCPVVTMDTAHTCTATFDLAATPIIWTDLVGAVVNGSTLAKTAPAGWGNGGAASTQFIPADGGIDLAGC